MIRHLVLAVVLGLALAPVDRAAAGEAPAEEKPLFEIGAIGGGGYVPDYPAAGQNHFQAIGLPYIVYRGDFLRSDERGLRGRILRTRNFEFDVSLGGSFSTDSDKNDARAGMPDLDWMGEIGPRLQITLARAARNARLDLELPVRAVFSTDLTSIDYRGFVFAPELAYQNEDFLDADYQVKLSLGPVLATERLMDYFYEVDPAFARPGRPAFDADPGYLGSRLQLLVSKPLGGRLTLFGAAQVGFHGGATNDASPLFQDDVTFAVGIGLAWSFWQSERRVKVERRGR